MIFNNILKIMMLPLIASLTLVAGCQEIQTLKREIEKKLKEKVVKTKTPFVSRDGITVRACPLYQTANQNSDVLHRLPAETQVHLVDRIGEWYRARTRDGREGYLDQKVIGGEELIAMTRELRKSIEGLPPQAEGVTKSKANFRFEPGRQHPVIEELPPGKKVEMYERVVTLRLAPDRGRQPTAQGSHPNRTDPAADPGTTDPYDESVKKDVWYKVRIDDGRVGYLYTHNLRFTPNDEIARMVPFMRIVAWRPISATDDLDRGAKNNYVAAYAPMSKDPGCDYTRLYFMNWATKSGKMVIGGQLRVSGMLPITNFQSEGRPGFSIRQLHPNKRDKLILSHFVFAKGILKKVSEEEIAVPKKLDPLRVPPDAAGIDNDQVREPEETPQTPDE